MARVISHHADYNRGIYGMLSTPVTGLFGDLARGKAQAEFSDNTNVHPAFGVQPKIERNRKLVQSVYRQTQGYMLIGDRTQETMSDPLHRPPRMILQAFRENNSVSYRSRGQIRPAAPGQVTWKNAYWRYQRPPYRQPIGPFTQGSMQQQSILQRVNMWLQGGNTNYGQQ
jgi:hypothetical protein